MVAGAYRVSYRQVRIATGLLPTADSFVRDTNIHSNYGTSPTLEVQKPATSGARWSYLKFDATGRPPASSVRLRLFGSLSFVSGPPLSTQVFPVASTTWTETGITWANKPLTGTVALDTEPLDNTTVARWYEWDVTAYVQQEMAAGRNVISLALKGVTASTPTALFRSRQSSPNGPQLVLVP